METLVLHLMLFIQKKTNTKCPLSLAIVCLPIEANIVTTPLQFEFLPNVINAFSKAIFAQNTISKR